MADLVGDDAAERAPYQEPEPHRRQAGSGRGHPQGPGDRGLHGVEINFDEVAGPAVFGEQHPPERRTDGDADGLRWGLAA